MNQAPFGVAIAFATFSAINNDDRCQTFSNGTGDSVTVCADRHRQLRDVAEGEHPDLRSQRRESLICGCIEKPPGSCFKASGGFSHEEGEWRKEHDHETKDMQSTAGTAGG